jgi:hypothetical protein
MGTLGQRVAFSDRPASSLGSMLSPHLVFTLTKWVMCSLAGLRHPGCRAGIGGLHNVRRVRSGGS